MNMDDHLDMDDLFGEGTNLPLPPAAAPTPRSLIQRLDDLRASGCNQKVAWSKLGCIAYINREGNGVLIRNLLCRPEDGKWILSSESIVLHMPSGHDSPQLVHLSWNPGGSELAVVDVLGRLSIFTIFIAVNRVNPSRSSLVDQEDDLGAIVGMSWLNIERQFPLYRPVVKDNNGQFQYTASTHKPLGPFHPIISRVTLVGVTRGGTVRLWYQHDARWLEVNTELESIGSSDDLISHASFSSDRDNSLLLAVHTISHQIRIYRININWNILTNQKPIPQSQVPSTASLQISHVKIDDFCFPQGPAEGRDMGAFHLGRSDVYRTDMSRAQLSHLEVISPAPPSKPNELSYPSIMAVFSYVPSPSEDSQQSSEVFSVIARWELRLTAQKLHPSFDNLGTRRNSVESANEQSLDLKRMNDTIVKKLVIAVEQIISSTIIVFSYGDGSIEFRERASMTPIVANEDFNRISSMPQAGFAFPNDGPSLHVALSPNCCLAIGIDVGGEAKLRMMEYTLGSLDTYKDDPKLASAVVALALQFAYSCTHHSNNDDLATVIQQYLSPQLEYQFLSEIQRAINLSVDYSHEPQHERLFRNPMIQRCLSLQNSLGYKGELKHRSLTAKIAWATLHLRLAALTFAFTFNNVKPAPGGAENDYTRPEVLHSLLGVVRWSMDLMNFVIDDLYVLARLTKGRTKDKAFVQQKVVESNSCALFVILASIPRTFLRYNSRGLRGLDGTAQKTLLSSTTDDEQRQVFASLKAIYDASPIKVPHFERILTDVDGSVKGAYQSLGISNDERGAAEKEMLINADIPDPLMSVVDRLLTTTLSSLTNEIDPAALYFEDPTWLGLSDDKRSDAYKRTHIVDALRKIRLTPGTNFRRCTRCCAYMADLVPQKGVSIWMTSMQRMCFCGSLWMLVKPPRPSAKAGSS